MKIGFVQPESECKYMQIKCFLNDTCEQENFPFFIGQHAKQKHEWLHLVSDPILHLKSYYFLAPGK